MAEVMGADDAGTPEEDWAGKATTTVVGYVDTVRAASTGKALVASRVAVYGLAAALVGVMMAVLLLIFIVRLLSSAVVAIFNMAEGTVWPVYLFLGTIFLVVGLMLWRKKEK